MFTYWLYLFFNLLPHYPALSCLSIFWDSLLYSLYNLNQFPASVLMEFINPEENDGITTHIENCYKSVISKARIYEAHNK